MTHLDTMPNTSEEFRELITGLIRMENERYEKILEALGDMRYTIRTIDKRLKKQAAIEKRLKKEAKKNFQYTGSRGTGPTQPTNPVPLGMPH